MQGDVRKAEDVLKWVKEATAKFGHLNILVNCAAGNFLVRHPFEVRCMRAQRPAMSAF